MTRPPPRELSVLAVSDLTTNMRRITLGGDGYEGLPEDAEGDYLKLFLGDADGHVAVRTYTIRRQRHARREVDVDFVLHGDHGLASAWALRTRPGDRVRVGGPGPGRNVTPHADWFFLAGDMTALPALSVNLEQLPPSARGYAVIEIIDEDDRQSLSKPEGIELHWVVNSQPGDGSGGLLDAVKARSWISGQVGVWAACEFETMRALRRYFKQDRAVGKDRIYVSSYWKHGLSEDQHKRVKKQDADAH